MTDEFDTAMMRAALKQAERAAERGEIPVGAVLTDGEGTVLAEAEVLRAAAGKREKRFFEDCTLYVTLEPCPMCAGAIVAARVGRVVYGAKDPRAGAFGSLLNLADYPLEATPQICGGVLEGECLTPLRAFFAEKRNKPT